MHGMVECLLEVDGDVVSVESWRGMEQWSEACVSYLMHDWWGLCPDLSPEQGMKNKATRC